MFETPCPNDREPCKGYDDLCDSRDFIRKRKKHQNPTRLKCIRINALVMQRISFFFPPRDFPLLLLLLLFRSRG